MRATALGIACAALLGCATHPLPPVPLADDIDAAGAAYITQMVAISAATASRVEPMLADETAVQPPFRTGDVWRQALPIATSSSDAVLHVDSSTIRWTLTAMGLASRYTYSVSATLTAGGDTIPLRAEGYARSAFGPSRAVREAVAMAVDDMARQALAHLPAKRTAAERLRNLEHLRAAGLISEPEYRSRRQVILQSL